MFKVREVEGEREREEREREGEGGREKERGRRRGRERVKERRRSTEEVVVGEAIHGPPCHTPWPDYEGSWAESTLI